MSGFGKLCPFGQYRASCFFKNLFVHLKHHFYILRSCLFKLFVYLKHHFYILRSCLFKLFVDLKHHFYILRFFFASLVICFIFMTIDHLCSDSFYWIDLATACLPLSGWVNCRTKWNCCSFTIKLNHPLILKGMDHWLMFHLFIWFF